MTRFCMDCMHHKCIDDDIHVCQHDAARDPVDGAMPPCREARAAGGPCGRAAILWSRRASLEALARGDWMGSPLFGDTAACGRDG